MSEKQTGSTNDWNFILWKLLKATPLIIAAIFFTYLGSRAGIIPDFEALALDTQMRLNLPLKQSDVAVVRITDKDYRKYFNEQSPMDPEGIRRIINAIARGGPKVIGIDLMTDDAIYRDFKPATDWPTIIWGRVGKGKDKLQPLSVLGGQQPSPCSGLVAVRADHDRMVRHYRRVYDEQEMADPGFCEKLKTEGGASVDTERAGCQSDRCPIPSLPWAMLKEFLSEADFKRLEGSAVETEELSIRLARARNESTEQPITTRADLTVEELLENYENNEDVEQVPPLLRNKMVLLGGDFAAARDEHETPLGTMSGVEILAQILETEGQGGGLPPPNLPVTAIILIFENFLLVILLHHFHKNLLLGLILCFITIPFMALACSLLSFHSIVPWVYFVPILFIVLIHELYDLAQERRKEVLKEVYDDFRKVSTRNQERSGDGRAEVAPKLAEAKASPKETVNLSTPKNGNAVLGMAFMVAVLAVMVIGSLQDKRRDR